MYKGRIGVGQYWGSALLLVLITLVAAGILVGGYYLIVLPLLLESSGVGLGAVLLLSIGGVFLAFILALIALPYIIGLQVRRFHDMGLTGWTVLLLFILGWVVDFFFPAADYSSGTPVILPLGAAIASVLFVVGVVIVSWPGTNGPNKYGEPVRYRSLWAAVKGKAT